MSTRRNGSVVGKQVRAFNLDHEVGAAIDAEADLLGPDKKSALVNQLLREALERRRNERVLQRTVVQFGEGTSILAVSIAILGVVSFALSVLV